MSNNQNESQASADKKNAKVFEWLTIVLSIGLSILFYSLADAPFDIASRHHWFYIFPAIYAIWLAICIHDIIADKLWITAEGPWPYWLLIALFVASSASMFAQPQQFGL